MSNFSPFHQQTDPLWSSIPAFTIGNIYLQLYASTETTRIIYTYPQYSFFAGDWDSIFNPEEF